MTYSSRFTLSLAASLVLVVSLFVSAAWAQSSPSPCSPVAEAEFGDPVICTGKITTNGKPLVVRLYWDILADTDELHVLRIETAGSESGKARATFDVDSRAPMTMEANGFEFGDFNFDGYTDFRLIEFLPAGPNIAYFNAVFDPSSGRHVAATGLNTLSAPEFEKDGKRVVSGWRGNAVTYGTDTFVWEGPDLVLVERQVSMFDENDNCMTTKFEPKGRVTANALAGDATELLSEVYESPCN